MVVAATADVLSRRIPNHLTVLTAVSFLPFALAAGMPSHAMLLHAGVGIAMLAVGFLLFSFNIIGGGDAKLLAAAAFWLGLDSLAVFLSMTVLAGGILALAVLAWSLLARDSQVKDPGLSSRIGWLKPSVPYGYAIAIGAILALPDSRWGRAFTP